MAVRTLLLLTLAAALATACNHGIFAGLPMDGVQKILMSTMEKVNQTGGTAYKDLVEEFGSEETLGTVVDMASNFTTTHGLEALTKLAYGMKNAAERLGDEQHSLAFEDLTKMFHDMGIGSGASAFCSILLIICLCILITPCAL